MRGIFFCRGNIYLAYSILWLIDENTEWQLSPAIFLVLSKKFGPFDMDLFASRLNNQCKRFCFWKPEFIDNFTAKWGTFVNSYLSPPLSIISKCLQKIRLEQAHVQIFSFDLVLLELVCSALEHLWNVQKLKKSAPKTLNDDFARDFLIKHGV